ncbi:hypothetical protein M0804_009641 [Polistes exclamans]|nr:hypothetical protein M0804_009641 [Polistes exclamans]
MSLPAPKRNWKPLEVVVAAAAAVAEDDEKVEIMVVAMPVGKPVMMEGGEVSIRHADACKDILSISFRWINFVPKYKSMEYQTAAAAKRDSTWDRIVNSMTIV